MNTTPLDYINDEDKCFQVLDSQNIFYQEIECPNCQNLMKRSNKKKMFRCLKHNCRKEVSIRWGTFFYKSALPTSRILLIAWEWTFKTPLKLLAQKHKFSPKTLVSFYNHFRILVGNAINEEKCKIGGPGVVVEIDECKMGKRKYHRGHAVEGVWIFGGVERENTEKVFFIKVADRSKETLQKLIIENIEKGSIVCSDMWRAYIGLDDLGYEHNVVNHSQNFKDPTTGTHTNTIEGCWNGLKLQIPPRSRTKTIDAALLEAIWRKQNKFNLWPALLACLRDYHYDVGI